MNSNDEQLYVGRYAKDKLLVKRKNKEIWLAVNKNSGEKDVIKIQPQILLDKPKNRNILNEASYLQAMQGHIGIPLMIWSGCEENELVLIVEYLGCTLQQRLDECGGKFNLKTVCMLAFQMLDVLQNLHDKNLVHRNISLNVWQFGRGEKSLLLFFNDMMECKWYKNKKTLVHNEEKKTVFNSKSIFWTESHYQSRDISRKHDVEMLLLMLVYLLKGELPWSKDFDTKSFQKVKEEGFYDLDLICEGTPTAFKEMLATTRALKYQEEPPYIWYKKRLEMLMASRKIRNDGVYEWLLKKSHRESLKVSPYIPSLKLERDEEFLREFYEPFQETMDIDEVGSKHTKVYGVNDSAIRSRTILEMEDESSKVQQKQKKKNKKKSGCVIM